MTPECGDDRDSVQHTDAISSNLEKLSSSGNIIASQNFCFYGKNSIQQGRECSATRHRPTGRLMAGNDDLLCANVSDDDDDGDDDDDMCALVCLL